MTVNPMKYERLMDPRGGRDGRPGDQESGAPKPHRNNAATLLTVLIVPLAPVPISDSGKSRLARREMPLI